MKLVEVEAAIYAHYQFFHETAPGVSVREEGRLAQLWRAFDMLVPGDAVN